VIVQALTEKLQLFADMAEPVASLEDTASRSRLLLRGDASDLQQGETLLKGAITEGRTMLSNLCICHRIKGTKPLHYVMLGYKFCLLYLHWNTVINRLFVLFAACLKASLCEVFFNTLVFF